METKLWEFQEVGMNGDGTKPRPYEEIGSTGLQVWSGFVQQAHDAELYWPGVYPLFNRIRRSDPEIGGLVRPAFAALARGIQLDWEAPDKPSSDDKKAQEYARTLFEDMEGGPDLLIETIASYVPFMGWGWWEVVAGVRNPAWRPPDKTDDWRSSYDDGLPAIRRLAWRDHASFEQWEADDKTGKVWALRQHDWPNPPVVIPRDRSLHLTFGDPVNPEGLSPLEAIWRLERIKYGLEMIQGIGYEHAAGYAKFTTVAALTTEDKSNIAEAARAIMTAQQGNYIRLPGHVTADIMDSGFTVAPAILEAIRYYGLLKLQVFAMQWMAIASTSGAGTQAAHSDSSEMAMMLYNAMWEGFAHQIDTQLGKRIFNHPLVRERFPGMTKRPRCIAVPVEKTIPLNLLSQFVSQIAPIVPMDDDDFIAIRRKSGFLPETLPEVKETPDEIVARKVDEVLKQKAAEDEGAAGAADEEDIDDAEEGADMALYRAVGDLLGELREAIVTPAD